MTKKVTDFRDQIVALLPRLRRFAFSLTANLADADDLVQAACERALSREQQWRPGTRLDSWMFRIIQTLKIDQARSMRQRSPHLPLEETTFGPVGDNEKNRIEAKMALGQVARAMQRLPENDRLVLSLVCVEGQSYKDAALTLQVPIGTVMSRLARARRRLHTMVHQKN
ncbi:MAG: RNA polymerase sigma factor [Deltaproteobacteria bacterium]|nr:MAG: RNA polymerase sigma factor [Deltaproteobacteria bacterium]